MLSVMELSVLPPHGLHICCLISLWKSPTWHDMAPSAQILRLSETPGGCSMSGPSSSLGFSNVLKNDFKVPPALQSQ